MAFLVLATCSLLWVAFSAPDKAENWGTASASPNFIKLLAELHEEDQFLGPPKLCPRDHPFAYRPLKNFDYCCRTGNSCHGEVGINSGPVDQRSSCCADNEWVACPFGVGCIDFAPSKTTSPVANKQPVPHKSNDSPPQRRCPSSHPYAYRPRHKFDYCCSTADSCSGIIGANSRADTSKRAACCKNHDHAPCPGEYIFKTSTQILY